MFMTDRLPGEVSPYGVRCGLGPRVLLGGMVAATLAGSAETGGLFHLARLVGNKGAGLPRLVHGQAHAAVHVTDGAVALGLGERCLRLEAGDYASIPPGTPWFLTLLRTHTALFAFHADAAPGGLYPALGQPFGGVIPPESDAGAAADLAAPRRLDGCDTEILGPAPEGATEPPGTQLPQTAEPYALERGEGERLLVADQMFTFAGAGAQSDGRFLALLTEGPAGEMIPPHMHLRHAETFICLAGAVRMRAGDNTVELAPGDFMHVPAGTPHAYQFLAPYTQMLGFLAPGLFEPFFRILGEPYAARSYPQRPGPFRFDRVLARLDELDIVPLGRPGG